MFKLGDKFLIDTDFYVKPLAGQEVIVKKIFENNVIGIGIESNDDCYCFQINMTEEEWFKSTTLVYGYSVLEIEKELHKIGYKIENIQ